MTIHIMIDPMRHLTYMRLRAKFDPYGQIAIYDRSTCLGRRTGTLKRSMWPEHMLETPYGHIEAVYAHHYIK